jgi:hypothetical protein
MTREEIKHQAVQSAVSYNKHLSRHHFRFSTPEHALAFAHPIDRAKLIEELNKIEMRGLPE